MDVTADNFEEAVQDLRAHLSKAAFVAIDEEMTGISIAGGGRYSWEDTPADRCQPRAITSSSCLPVYLIDDCPYKTSRGACK
jgi:hypothetical protein